MSINQLKALAAALALMSVVTLAGCASNSTAMPDVRYDLGAPPANSTANNGTPMPPVKVLAVSAPRNLETDAFDYRLSYVDAQRIDTYSNSHWTMPPAQLITQRSFIANVPAPTGDAPGGTRLRPPPTTSSRS